MKILRHGKEENSITYNNENKPDPKPENHSEKKEEELFKKKVKGYKKFSC